MIAVSTVEMWNLEAADFLSLLRGRNAAVKHFERTAIMQHTAFMHSMESRTIFMEESSRSKGLKIKERIVVDGEMTGHDQALSRMNDQTHHMIMKSSTLQQQISLNSDGEGHPPTPKSPGLASSAETDSTGAGGGLASTLLGGGSGRLRAGSTMIRSVITSTMMGGKDVGSQSSISTEGLVKFPVLTLRLVETDKLTQHDMEEA